MPTPYPKEQMHRIKYTKLTPEQMPGALEAACVKRNGTWTLEHVTLRTD